MIIFTGKFKIMNELKENEKILLEQFYLQLNNINSLNELFTNQVFSFDETLCCELETIIKIERRIFNYYIQNGELVSILEEIPFNNEEIEYIKKRLINSQNNLIKSRYAHILWRFTKHNDYAKIAVNSYLSLVDNMLDNLDISNINILQYLMPFITCLFFILKRSQTNIDERPLKEKIVTIIKSDTIHFLYKYILLNYTFTEKIFKPEELEFTLSIGKTWIEHDKSTSSNEDILNLLIKIAEKNKKSTAEYYILLAEDSMLLLTQQHADPQKFFHSFLLNKIAGYYKKANVIEKYEEIIIKYSEAKSKMIIPLMSITVDLKPELSTQYYEFLTGRINYILSLNSNEILGLLSNDNDLIKASAATPSENSFFDTISQINFDINGNCEELNKENIIKQKINRNYGILIQVIVLPVIRNVMLHGLIKEKFNGSLLFDYLRNTWFGEKINRNQMDTIDNNLTWLDFLAPALHEFLSKFQFYAKNHIEYSYVLCIDSLVLKFEGILRDFIRLRGGVTTVMKRRKNNSNYQLILQEQVLEELLENPKITESFSEEDIALFKYVFTKSGLDIRNNIAHCFYLSSKYTQDIAILVFLCILRLSKYYVTNNNV